MDRLIEKIVKMENPSVVGLDPKLEYIPDYIKKMSMDLFGNTPKAAAHAIFQFNMQIIDAVCDVVPAVKPQVAYYELYGSWGIRALEKTISHAKQKGMYVIADGKRNDIGSTMEAYCQAYLGDSELFCNEKYSAFGSDSLTVNPYLGSDCVKPLLKKCDECDKSIFILLKTSNPSSKELQDEKLIGGETICERVGKMCEEFGKNRIGKYGYSRVGAVVGATYPKELKNFRQQFPHTFFLIPGYGAQGGKSEDVAFAFKDGLGAIVNSSRSILCAWKKNDCLPEKFAVEARMEALRMKDDIISKL